MYVQPHKNKNGKEWKLKGDDDDICQSHFPHKGEVASAKRKIKFIHQTHHTYSCNNLNPLLAMTRDRSKPSSTSTAAYLSLLFLLKTRVYAPNAS